MGEGSPVMRSLFKPLTQKSMTLRNRIVMSPMCMYCAGKDGVPTDWHFVHYGARAVGGAALVISEATSVEPRGRLSEGDLGIWNDEQAAAFARIARFVQSQGAKFGIQLAHGGRKAWSDTLGHGPGAPVGPSAIRARDIGCDMVEIHAAHGYLLHQFLSPLSNSRSDEYGGSFENRARLLNRVVEAVKSVWPADRPVWVRVSATDWIEGGWDADQTVRLAGLLREWGIDLVDTSTGGNAPAQIPLKPGYQVPFAERIRREAGMPSGAVGLITTPELADEIIESGKADVVVLARQLLRDPYFPLHAAEALGEDVPWPEQYERAKPRRHA